MASFFLTGPLDNYLSARAGEPDEVERDLLEETSALGWVSMMQISTQIGQLLKLLVKMSGARRAVEVGTFTGYSSLCVARALPSDGTLLCCDINEQWTGVARRYWERAGVSGKVDLRLGPALDTLRAMPAGDDQFDFAFIDADKGNYANYYEEILGRMRPGGVIAVDNVLWSGTVLLPRAADDDTKAIKAFNNMVHSDSRVDSTILAIGDGLGIAVKR